jgi:hypothetical protein
LFCIEIAARIDLKSQFFQHFCCRLCQCATHYLPDTYVSNRRGMTLPMLKKLEKGFTFAWIFEQYGEQKKSVLDISASEAV